MASFLIHSLLLLWGAACALQDAREKRIGNPLSLAAMIVAAGTLLATGQTFTGASPAAAAGAVALALLFTVPGYVTARMGAGDVKYLVALALATDALYLSVCVAGGAVAAIFWLTVAPALWPRLPLKLQSQIVAMAPGDQSHPPYAPFLFAGMLAASAWYA